MAEIKSQKERLDEIIETNKEKYTMKEIMTVFAWCMDGYEKRSNTVKEIKKKITRDEWNSLINGITMTLFMSLHAFKSSDEEIEKMASTEGVIGIQVAIVKEKDK